jgi:hypothetical protein
VAHDDAIVHLSLRAASAADLLDEDETIHAADSVSQGYDEYALVITDKRLFLFEPTMLTGLKTKAELRLDEIDTVHVGRSTRRKGKRSLITIRTHAGVELVLDNVTDLDRAHELAETITEARDTMRRTRDGLFDPDRFREEPEPRVRITIGRGVVDYVRRRGGSLYIWGDPFGGGFERLRVSTSPPTKENELVLYENVREIELYLERYLLDARQIRVARRWWLPRGGLIAESGLWMDRST